MLKQLQSNQHKWAIILLAFLVFIAGGVVYSRILFNGFINFDDPFYVVENQQVLRGLTVEGVKWAFTTTHAANWHPLTWLSHMLDVQFFGTNPSMHHLTSLFIHAINSTLFFLFFARTTGTTGRSFIAALLFALHPLHVESVAWASERKDLLCGLFWFLGLHAYICYTRRPVAFRYILVLFLFACALLTKPMAVTFPLTLLILDFWPLNRLENALMKERHALRELIVEKIPFLLLSAASCVITFLAQKTGGAINPMMYKAMSESALNTEAAIPRYLLKVVWPVNLAVLYPFDPNWKWGLAGLLIMTVVTLVAWRFRNRSRYFLFGWLWFVATLLPVIGIIPFGLHSIADRYMYIPLSGLFIAITWGVSEACRRLPLAGRILPAGAAIVLLVLSVFTWRQTYFWRDSITLFSHSLIVTKQSWMAEHQLGTAFLSERMYPAAYYHLSEAYRLNPSYVPTMFNLAIIYKKNGDNINTLRMLREAARFSPKDIEIKYSLFRIYKNMGEDRK